MALRSSDWRKLPLSLAELCIDTTLRCGQSFRWRKMGEEWHCALHGRIVSLKQDPSHLHFLATWPKTAAGPTPLTAPSPLKDEQVPAISSVPPEEDTETLLRSYFNLHLDLPALYEQWSRDDANFRKKAPGFTGIRILNQDAWEALVAFICSSNNNIARISQMVHKLCLHYGPLLGRIGEEPFHDFPGPEALAGPKVESHLRELGFGYRAKYIADTARVVSREKPAGWLATIRNPQSPSRGASTPPSCEATYRDAHEKLLSLSGVGPKVADCVCLMGLGWGEAVPVDTHVWQIAVRDYKFGKAKTKTFSRAMYDAVGDHFRQLWGEQAGWAQSVLFTANLRSFSDRLTGGMEAADVSDIKEKKQEQEEQEGQAVAEASGPSARESRKRKMPTIGVKIEAEGRDADLLVASARTRKKRRG